MDHAAWAIHTTNEWREETYPHSHALLSIRLITMAGMICFRKQSQYKGATHCSQTVS